MTVFDNLSTIYADIDDAYAADELSARARGFHVKELKIQNKRKLNDQAYFLFMFTRLEERVSSQVTLLINQKSTTITNYRNKRAWQILKSKNDDDRLHFKEKASLLLTFGGADYTLVLVYYKQRNTIAHGGTVPAINIPTVLTDFKRLYAALAI
jgi:negative regulator of genetic competence, sporulation and motility